jgi:hypothetical protein
MFHNLTAALASSRERELCAIADHPDQLMAHELELTRSS